MKGAMARSISSKGFTLVEVILTLMAAGILSVFFVNYMGSALDFSWKSVEIVTTEAETEGKMEEIIAYYTSKINDDPGTALSTVVLNYNGQTINDILVTTQYIEFNFSGNEIDPSPSLSSVLKVSAKGPANELVMLLTESRGRPDDPKVRY